MKEIDSLLNEFKSSTQNKYGVFIKSGFVYYLYDNYYCKAKLEFIYINNSEININTSTPMCNMLFWYTPKRWSIGLSSFEDVKEINEVLFCLNITSNDTEENLYICMYAVKNEPVISSMLSDHNAIKIIKGLISNRYNISPTHTPICVEEMLKSIELQDFDNLAKLYVYGEKIDKIITEDE